MPATNVVFYGHSCNTKQINGETHSGQDFKFWLTTIPQSSKQLLAIAAISAHLQHANHLSGMPFSLLIKKNTNGGVSARIYLLTWKTFKNSILQEFSFDIIAYGKRQALILLKLLDTHIWYLSLFFFFLNWDSPHARLNSHYKAWSYKKRNTRKITGYRKSV